MRALVLSDLHLGAWTGDPVLSRPYARERLAEHLEGLDELILLGDVFDFLFSSVEDAFAQAEPFFDLVADRMRGGRVVFLAGNHDHHITVRDLRTAVEIKVATGCDGPALERAYAAEHRNFFQRYLDRRLPGVESELVYPAYRFGETLLCHGHYLDAHMSGSLANRLLIGATWRVAGGRPQNGSAPRLADYESCIVPLTELLFSVAQMPHGQDAQMRVHDHVERLGKVLRVAGVAHRLRRRCRAPRVPEQLDAYAQVVHNLGWDGMARQFVFGHTHRPLDGVEHRGLRYWNTGSWIHEPATGEWPGTAVLLDTAAREPQLVQILTPADARALDLGH